MTSDERREVAARLRKCGAELSILGADCETSFHVIDKVIGGNQIYRQMARELGIEVDE